MQDRFKFRAILKTDTHSIIAEPHYIFDNGYLVNIDDVQKPFEKKYPDDCFWEFIEEIEKQENCQEVSTDSEIIIFDSFDGLMQCTGLKDGNGILIYEHDIVKTLYTRPDGVVINKNCVVEFNRCAFWINYGIGASYLDNDDCIYEVIGNVFQDKELLNEQ